MCWLTEWRTPPDETYAAQEERENHTARLFLLSSMHSIDNFFSAVAAARSRSLQNSVAWL
jgi:hypothetical protein